MFRASRQKFLRGKESYTPQANPTYVLSGFSAICPFPPLRNRIMLLPSLLSLDFNLPKDNFLVSSKQKFLRSCEEQKRLKMILFQEICFGRMILIKMQMMYFKHKILPCVFVCAYHLPSTSH